LFRDQEGQADPQFDWYPERNNVHDNVIMGNGQSPQEQAALISGLLGVSTLAEMVWDGVVDWGKVFGDGGEPDSGAVFDAGIDEGPPPVVPDSLKNCFKNNGAATFVNIDFDHLGANKSSDPQPYACDLPPLPPITL
jgi:hypothetical protein